MTSDDLSRILSKREKISLPKAKKLVKSFISALEDTLKQNEKVTFSNFGTFLTHRYPSKTIRDPQGRGHKVVMLPTNVIKWHPSPQVRARVNRQSFLGKLFHHDQNTSSEQKSSTVVSPKDNPEKPADEIPIKPLIKPEAQTTQPNQENQEKQLSKGVDSQPDNMQPASSVDTNLPDNIAPLKNNEIDSKSIPEQIAKPIDNQPVNEKDNIGINNDTIQKDKEKTEAETESEIEIEKPRISFEDFVKNAKTNDLEINTELTDQGENEEKPKQVKVEEGTPAELIHKKVVSEPAKPLVGTTSIEFADLSKIQVDKNILSLIPEKFARQYQVVPISSQGNQLTIGMIDPEDLEAIELIKKQTGREVVPKLAITADVNRILDQYSGVETEVTEAISASQQEKTAIDKDDKDDKDKEKLVEDAPVARIVQSLIKRAVREQASDIHVEPAEDGLEVRFRIDGILHKKVTIPKDIQASLISRVKILSGIKIDESRLPQDGRIQMQIDNRRVDFRVSTMPTAYGEKVVMRILDKSAGILSLKDLGLRGHGYDIIENCIHKSHGMTLVTGPTGSGKTTSLYAIIDRLLDVTVNIVTLEDPIEYQIPGINQSQVNSDINYTFANGLRSILRQDPDVVMIGEIRDKETAEMAVNAALTGHIVLSTLHTNDSSGAGPRLIDMGVEPFLITSSLNSVIGQRLARRLCKNCQEEEKISDKELSEVKEQIAKMPPDVRKKWDGKKLVFHTGKGCAQCHDTGYKGRLGIFEVLEVSSAIQNLLLERATASKINEAAVNEGMLTMQQDGIDKALDGLTSLSEVWRVTKE